jgi:hypothetical protein
MTTAHNRHNRAAVQAAIVLMSEVEVAATQHIGWHPNIAPGVVADSVVFGKGLRDSHEGSLEVSLASLMGPPCCQEHGTTWGPC